MRARVMVMVAVFLATATAEAQTVFERGRIPHRDGSGRATILEVAPGVPGAREFLRDDDRPAPKPGEISLPSPAPAPSPSAAVPRSGREQPGVSRSGRE
jgi:hypothetical protein